MKDIAVGAIIPAAVGVDIGCGMIAVRTPLKRADIPDPAAVRSGIERRIPMSDIASIELYASEGMGVGRAILIGWRPGAAPS